MDNDWLAVDFLLISELENLSFVERLGIDEARILSFGSRGFVLVGKIRQISVAIGGLDIDDGVGGDRSPVNFFGIDLS